MDNIFAKVMQNIHFPREPKEFLSKTFYRGFHREFGRFPLLNLLTRAGPAVIVIAGRVIPHILVGYGGLSI